MIRFSAQTVFKKLRFFVVTAANEMYVENMLVKCENI